MRSEWNEYTVQGLIDNGMLDEPLDGNHGGIHPKTSDYVDKGVPFIMASDLHDGLVDYTTSKFISQAQAKTLRKGFARPGDILLTHKATLGRTAIVDDTYDLIILTPQITYYRTKSGLVNRYLKYYFDSREFQSLFFNWAASGSTRNYLGITAQKKLPIIVPSLPKQRAIATTLSCLDDKIELNNKINANLEEQAQAIFKSWFVNFEPFHERVFVDSKLGLIPDGWRVQPLTDIAQYLNGLAMQRFRPLKGEHGLSVLKIKELRQGKCDFSSELCSESIKAEYIVNDGDVIFSWSGSLLIDIWCGGICGLNQHLFKVTSNDYEKWFYYFWTKHYLDKFVSIAAGKATTMGHIKRSDLESSLVVIPDEQTYKEATAVLSPMIKQIVVNRIQSRTLAALRDALLPKLINGEIEVPIGG